MYIIHTCAHTHVYIQSTKYEDLNEDSYYRDSKEIGMNEAGKLYAERERERETEV